MRADEEVDGMGELIGIARFTFHEGRADDFKRLSARCMEVVRARDTGTLQYDVHLDEDETAAVVIERYASEAALAEHLEHLGPDLMAEITGTADVEGELLGAVSPEFRARMAGGPVRLLAPYLTL
jgi:quinol monooxygenase YgiN